MGAPPCWCVCTRTRVCLFVCLCAACVVCVRFSAVLHASFARLRDAVESSRSARPAVIGALSGPVPCRDPALPESVSTRHARTLTCCAAPSIITRTITHERARTRGCALQIGSAAPGRPSQLKRRLWTAPLAHASTTRRARAADAFGARTRQGRVAAEGRRLQLLGDRRGGEVLE